MANDNDTGISRNSDAQALSEAYRDVIDRASAEMWGQELAAGYIAEQLLEVYVDDKQKQRELWALSHLVESLASNIREIKAMLDRGAVSYEQEG